MTVVCTGSLLFGAVGLLRGRNATMHWAFTDLLELFGANYTKGRVVVDGDRIIGGGVTVGIDFALMLVALLRGEDAARRLTLRLEYDPAPPFACGHPDRAERALVDEVRAALRATVEDRRALLAT